MNSSTVERASILTRACRLALKPEFQDGALTSVVCVIGPALGVQPLTPITILLACCRAIRSAIPLWNYLLDCWR